MIESASMHLAKPPRHATLFVEKLLMSNNDVSGVIVRNLERVLCRCFDRTFVGSKGGLSPLDFWMINTLMNIER